MADETVIKKANETDETKIKNFLQNEYARLMARVLYEVGTKTNQRLQSLDLYFFMSDVQDMNDIKKKIKESGEEMKKFTSPPETSGENYGWLVTKGNAPNGCNVFKRKIISNWVTFSNKNDKDIKDGTPITGSVAFDNANNVSEVTVTIKKDTGPFTDIEWKAVGLAMIQTNAAKDQDVYLLAYHNITGFKRGEKEKGKMWFTQTLEIQFFELQKQS